MRAEPLAALAAALVLGWTAAASSQISELGPYPPWQNGANNDALDRGVDFTVARIDDLADFHGDLTDPKLVLYVGGNYFFVMAPLVRAFEAAHPEYRGRLFWETLPPGVLVEQIKAGGRITSGNMTFTARGDAYFAGLAAVKSLVQQGVLTGPAMPYVTNTLAIMVAKGNPKSVASLTDLARDDVRLAMPNPAFEGIARQIRQSLVKVGGEALARRVYETRVTEGGAVLTRIHHRQTPLFLRLGEADVGVVWRTEALFQEEIGAPLSHVEIPPEQNATETYAGAVIAGAVHPEAARLWLEFIRTPQAMAIFAKYGFKPAI